MCSPFWVSFLREINWQSAKIYQHIARLSDKLRQWGNQLCPCRYVRLPPPHLPLHPPHAFPQLSTTAQSLGKARRVKRSALIYLFESLIHQPLQMTLAADDYRIPNPTPPCSDKTGVWGGGDYHKKHTNQRGTMNPVTGRRRRWRWFFFPLPFLGEVCCACHN